MIDMPRLPRSLRPALLLALSLLLGTAPGWGAAPGPPQTAAQLTQDMVWRNIGPANMGGRITDIEAVEGDFSVEVGERR
jgi:hypothetical protein